MKQEYLRYMRFIPAAIVAFIAFKFVNEQQVITNVVSFLSTLFAPLIWAGVIAYILNPVLKKAQKLLKLKRLSAVLLIYFLVFILLVGAITIIVPITINSIADIIRDLPKYSETANAWYQDRVRDFQALERFANTFNFSFESFLSDESGNELANLSKDLQNFVLSLGRTLFDFTSGVFKFVMGFILSIYILLEKEAHAKQAKRVACAFLGDEKSKHLINLAKEIDMVFGKYLIGKTIDSLIIGIICYVGLLLIGVKYAVLLAITVGITNMIPYFGPIIGAVPAVLITLFNSPIQALWVAIFILILQQVDGNIIGPYILGDSVGMSPIWIIIAIIFGGGLFGVPGMLLGVPVVAVIRNLINRHVDRVLGET